MNKLNFTLKLLVVLVFALFFSIIGVNKKTIDSYDDKNTLEENINNLRGIIWANYTILTISLAIAITIIISKNYYYNYKWTVIFAIFFIILNTGLVAFEEVSIKNNKSVQISDLNNVYIITCIMNIIYFILFVRMIKITDDITKEPEPSIEDIQTYLHEGPYRTGYGPGNRYTTEYRDYDNSPSDFGGVELGDGRVITSDDVIFDEEKGIIIRPRTRIASM
jgi:hypothetical protein